MVSTSVFATLSGFIIKMLSGRRASISETSTDARIQHNYTCTLNREVAKCDFWSCAKRQPTKQFVMCLRVIGDRIMVTEPDS